MVGARSATTATGLLLGVADDGDGDDAATATAVESPAALGLGARTRPLFAFFALLPMVCETVDPC